MDIKDFIKETISGISDAIQELNSEKHQDGLVVSPSKFSSRGGTCAKYEDGRPVERIEFNLNVIVTDKTGGGGGVRISIVEAGINTESVNSSNSTIKFSIPVVFPHENHFHAP